MIHSLLIHPFILEVKADVAFTHLVGDLERRAVFRDVFYVFNPVAISLCGSTGFTFDTYPFSFGTGSCAIIDCTLWNDDSCGSLPIHC